MTSSEHNDLPGPSDPLRCATCSSRLAYDQRYCLQCGTRRGPLPSPVAELLGAMLESGRGPAREQPAEPAPAPAWTGNPRLPFGFTMPSPRAAAVGVMGMLAFGVIISSSVRPPLETLSANAPLLLAVSPSGNAGGGSDTAGSGSQGGGDTSGGGGGTTTTEVVTVIQTTPAPASSTPSTAGATSSGSVGSSSPGTGSGTGSPPTNPYGLPAVKHVFLIMLSDAGFNQTFGPGSQDKYLSKTLPRQGRLINNYYAVAGSGLANGIALLSGQGPTQQTAADCPTYTAITPGTVRKGQVIGNGCVYPKKTPTLGGELTAKHLTWKAYIEGIDFSATGQPTSCRHPALGAQDQNQAPAQGDPYVTWRNPFVYFGSLTAARACAKNDVGIEGLTSDLQDPTKAPALAYIVPSPCDNGNPQPCRPGAEAGLAATDRFLQTILPEIKQSPAYKDNGLIAITSDEAPQSGPNADPSACCGTPKYPNLPTGSAASPTSTSTTSTSSTSTSTTSTTSTSTSTSTTSTTDTSTTPTTSTSTSSTTPTTSSTSTSTTSTSSTTPTTPTSSNTGATGQTSPTGGGGQVGILLISSFVKKNTVDLIDYYNHYSLLATIEEIFGVKKLGYANRPGLPIFDAGIFNANAPG